MTTVPTPVPPTLQCKNLLQFTYSNAATAFCVNATEYLRHDGSEFRLTVIDGDQVRTTAPASRAATVQQAEQAVAGFVRRMAAVYG
jgi:hypothetical protein